MTLDLALVNAAAELIVDLDISPARPAFTVLQAIDEGQPAQWGQFAVVETVSQKRSPRAPTPPSDPGTTTKGELVTLIGPTGRNRTQRDVTRESAP